MCRDTEPEVVCPEPKTQPPAPRVVHEVRSKYWDCILYGPGLPWPLNVPLSTQCRVTLVTGQLQRMRRNPDHYYWRLYIKCADPTTFAQIVQSMEWQASRACDPRALTHVQEDAAMDQVHKGSRRLWSIRDHEDYPTTFHLHI